MQAAMTIGWVLLTIGVGAAWRAWFGSGRPDWAFPGYRAMQVAVGVAGFAALHPSLLGLALAGLAVGALTLPIQVYRPIWWAWERTGWVRANIGAEATQGALVFGVAALVWGLA